MSKVRQTAVLPYRIEDDGLHVLLITSRRRGRWIIPKGFVEPGLTANESAAFEAFEEAGIAGAVDRSSIGSYTYRKQDVAGGTACKVRVYAMRVDQTFDDYPDAKFRRRKWMTPAEAIDSVEETSLKNLLAAFGAEQGKRL